MISQEREKITKRMLWIIPAMILCIIGDYCMGLEPKNSTAVSFMISTGWLTIADWRIALSNIGGLIGSALYMVAVLAFVRYLNGNSKRAKGERKEYAKDNGDEKDREAGTTLFHRRRSDSINWIRNKVD